MIWYQYWYSNSYLDIELEYIDDCEQYNISTSSPPVIHSSRVQSYSAIIIWYQDRDQYQFLCSYMLIELINVQIYWHINDWTIEKEAESDLIHWFPKEDQTEDNRLESIVF